MDESVGKNDGTVKGEQYFSCEPRHGLFVRASEVELTISTGEDD